MALICCSGVTVYDFPAVVWLLLALLTGLTIRGIAQHVQANKVIDKHGARAPRFRSWIPLDCFGTYFVYELIRHGRKAEYLKFAHNCFVRTGAHSKRPYTFEVNIGWKRAVWTADPQNIKAMLATQFDDYGRGKAFRKRWSHVLGTSIFNVDGQVWHESRQRMRPLFTRQRISNLELFERHVQNLMLRLDKTEPVDVKDVMSRFALDATADYAFGRTTGALSDRRNDFLDALEHIKTIQSIRECAGPLSFMIPSMLNARNVRTMEDFIMPSISEAISLSPWVLDTIDKKDENWTFLHALASVSRDPDFIKYEIMSIMLAGRDTVSSTLTWTLIELARNPKLVTELRQEIASIVGVGEQASTPSLTDLKQMKLLYNILNETLRLYPTVSLNLRCALRDTSLPRGGGPDGTAPVGLAAGTPIVFSSQILHLSPESYENSPTASSAEVYDPHRWDTWTPKSWTYIPFGGGPRVCLGQQLAMTEMAYVLVRIFQRFSKVEQAMPVPENDVEGWERPSGSPSFVEKFLARSVRISGDITLSPRDVILLRFKP